MDKAYWQSRWQEEDIPFNQQEPSPHLVQFFSRLKLKKGSRVFVPLCGKSVDMMWLLNQGYSVMGVELHLQACQQFFEEHQLIFKSAKTEYFDILSNSKIKLFSGDFFDLRRDDLGDIDAVYDRAALIALPSAMRQQYAQKIISLIEPKAQVLLSSLSYNQNDMEGPPFSVDLEEVSHHFAPLYKIEELLKVSNAQPPEHLKEKGLKHFSEAVYHLERI